MAVLPPKTGLRVVALCHLVWCVGMICFPMHYLMASHGIDITQVASGDDDYKSAHRPVYTCQLLQVWGWMVFGIFAHVSASMRCGTERYQANLNLGLGTALIIHAVDSFISGAEEAGKVETHKGPWALWLLLCFVQGVLCLLSCDREWVKFSFGHVRRIGKLYHGAMFNVVLQLVFWGLGRFAMRNFMSDHIEQVLGQSGQLHLVGHAIMRGMCSYWMIHPLFTISMMGSGDLRSAFVYCRNFVGICTGMWGTFAGMVPGLQMVMPAYKDVVSGVYCNYFMFGILLYLHVRPLAERDNLITAATLVGDAVPANTKKKN